MFKNALTFILLLFASLAWGQSSLKAKGGLDSLRFFREQIELAFLNISSDDSIADIGTGSGGKLVEIANHYPELKFTVEDIDSSTCNREQLLKVIQRSGNKIPIDNFEIIYGTEKSTNLPSGKFNKVLIFDVIHEMTFKSEMLADIRRILQRNGSVFIDEILVRRKVRKDKGCNYPYLTESAFRKLMDENGFLIKREKITYYVGKNRYIKIFECTLKG